MDEKTKIDKSKLSTDQLAQLEQHQASKRQLLVLEDLADMVQDMVGLFDKQLKTGERVNDGFGALLMDIRESLDALKDKEAPESPDYAKPVVEAVKKLETALTAAMKVKPEVHVNAPQVNVEAPLVDVDLKGVEKILKTDLPKAFKETMKLLPKVEFPKEDYTPLLEKFDAMLSVLNDIDTATRMKPLPGSIKISNLNEVPIVNSPTTGYGISNIEDTGTYKYFGYENKDGAWYIMRKTLADNTYLYAASSSGYSTAWTNRASHSYASYGSTF